MPRLRTTAGNLLLNEAIPAPLRDYGRVWDKKGTHEFLRRLAAEHPDEYVDVSQRLADLGRRVATESGGYSFGPEHMGKAAAARKIAAEIQRKLQRILDNDQLTPKQRNEAIVRTVGG